MYASVVSHLGRIGIQIWIEQFSLYGLTTNIDIEMCQIVISWDKIYIISLQLLGEIRQFVADCHALSFNKRMFNTENSTNEKRSLKLYLNYSNKSAN
jgi:hypothetical protein